MGTAKHLMGGSWKAKRYSGGGSWGTTQSGRGSKDITVPSFTENGGRIGEKVMKG